MMEKSIPFPRYSSLNISILRPVSNRQKSRRNHACSVKCPRNNRMPLIFPRREENSTFQWIFRTRYSFHSSHSKPSTIPLLSLFSPLFPSISVTRDCFRIRFLLFLFSLCLSLSLRLSFPNGKEFHSDSFGIKHRMLRVTQSDPIRRATIPLRSITLPSPPLFNDRITFHGIPPPDR